ncbi:MULTISPECIES: tol-pal system protein YbgF [Leisingera]|mgnify:CR=1 FL=1|jgi:tol-pal system protein YbgF|uniref:tol-pal system protein YbgF n=1 Tax=Leisingera TaxID=191028 RepID=UPI00114D769E|nr:MULTISPECIES: tol-pal system protein YbgF [Leisingera]QDI75005.1 tol-pal system protein YbgF [Leisingera aquaemixtae]UWQ36409.1 tol-pal system protein YbgF [Leisingera aquaemixtae]UWQ44773.1 tol-pal system protein YbgF [Leisingera aquaemixtae]
MKPLRTALLATVMLLPLPLAAQDQQTLADIRQELTVLHVEVQRLKRELSTTGSPSADVSGNTVLDRVAAIEGELQRLTLKTEELGHRIDRIVADGTNRIGDLEFRLVELEGGDVGALGETTTLGGGELPAAVAVAPQTADGGTAGGELAIGEQADFDAAEALLAEGQYQEAAEKLAAFNQAYPGSPLAAAAEFSRGKALDGLGDTREAARAYLAAFSGNSAGPVAPKALFELGAALGRLGQTDQACVTLSEVGVRFPGTSAEEEARAELAKLGCS